MIRRNTLLVVALVLVASACAGPRRPVPIGVKDVPTDVLLGEVADIIIPRMPPAPDPVIPPRRVLRPVQTFRPIGPIATPTPLCPQADPLSASPFEARSRVTDGAVAATYIYRTSGSVTVDGTKFALPPVVTRTVRNVSGQQVPYTFELVEDLAGTTTTSFYQVATNGITITRQITDDGQNETEFEWTPPLTILPFPAQAGATWSVASTALDGVVVMTYNGRIGEFVEDGDDANADPDYVNPKVRIDACGTFIDAWNVQLGASSDGSGAPNGTLVSPSGTLTFKDTFAIPTAFGGFPIADSRVASGTASGAQIELERESIINTVPLLP